MVKDQVSPPPCTTPHPKAPFSLGEGNAQLLLAPSPASPRRLGVWRGQLVPDEAEVFWCSCLTIRNWTAALNSFLTSHLDRHQMVNTFSLS